MNIITIEGMTIVSNGGTLWLVTVGTINMSTGEGVIVPFVFDTPEDAEDATKHFVEIAKLQGGEVETIKGNPFSRN